VKPIGSLKYIASELCGTRSEAMSYWIVIVSADEGTAPGFTAVRDAVPAVAISEAGMATLKCVASTIVVVR
jgi:hypothetical protein